MAKFSRGSTAYADDGSVVAANTPRMSERGLLIEEGTTNLLPSTVQNAVVNSTTKNSAYFAITTGLVQGGTYTLHGYKRIFDDDVSVYTRVTLALKYSDGTVKNVQQLTPAKDGNWYSFQLSLTADSTKTLTNVYGWICDFSGFTGLMHQECKLCQLEQKSYATSYTDGTRAVDLFKIPVEAINPTAWTIEFDAQLNDIHNYNILLDSRGNTKGVKMALFAILGGAVQLQYYTDATTWAGVNTAIAVPDKLKHHYKISYDGSNINLYFDGVLKKTVTDVTLYNGTASVTNYLNVGFSGDGYYLDGYISNLRISNVCRPDNDTTPAVDSHTTYYMPLTDNLNFTADAELEEQYTVGKTSVDENWVTFTLGAGYSLRTRRPFYRYMKNSCPFKYKGTRCACTSSEATCRHTLADCRSRGNSKRYGGFPGIDQKGLYLE